LLARHRRGVCQKLMCSTRFGSNARYRR
jgi:hypothetical protein